MHQQTWAGTKGSKGEVGWGMGDGGVWIGASRGWAAVCGPELDCQQQQKQWIYLQQAAVVMLLCLRVCCVQAMPFIVDWN